MRPRISEDRLPDPRLSQLEPWVAPFTASSPWLTGSTFSLLPHVVSRQSFRVTLVRAQCQPETPTHSLITAQGPYFLYRHTGVRTSAE